MNSDCSLWVRSIGEQPLALQPTSLAYLTNTSYLAQCLSVIVDESNIHGNGERICLKICQSQRF